MRRFMLKGRYQVYSENENAQQVLIGVYDHFASCLKRYKRFSKTKKFKTQRIINGYVYDNHAEKGKINSWKLELHSTGHVIHTPQNFEPY